MEKLPKINVRSPDWAELRNYVVDQMEMEKERVMASAMTPEETNQARGRYAAYKKIVGLEKLILTAVNRAEQA